MKSLRRMVALIDHSPIEGEFDRFRILDDAAFQAERSKHLARKRWPDNPENVGVVFIMATIGALGSLFFSIIKSDVAYAVGSIFWLVVGVSTFAYLSAAARYWREHHAIRNEEFRRYGRTTFGG